MRLIDADEFKRQIENALRKQNARDYDLVKVSELPILIDKHPTAYDVDKVVERLETDEKHTFDGCINKRYAIEIVKAGGISD